MEEALVGAVVGATVQVLLQNLISVTLTQIKLLRNFKSDLENLKSTLVTIQEFVCDAETLSDNNKPVKRWLNKLEDVAFQAYYVFDELDYLRLRNNRHKMEPKKTTFKEKIKSMASKFHDRSKFGHKIRDINKDFESINREASSLGLQTRLAGIHASGVASRASGSPETDSFTCDPVFLGRGEDVQQIVEKVTNFPADQVFHILPIVGMGGMGKSTLAREVLKVQTRFQTCIWVHVSANFDPIMLFKKMLMILTEKDDKVENRELVLKMLQKALENKTYLLVLDDVWNHDGIKWEGFINSLSGITSTKGNGIIVTTRKRNVASIVATLPIHDLQGLSKDSCWSIIKAKAFGEYLIPSEFETLGKSIAKRCQGLPLAANVVGGVLRGKSKEEWVSIQENWLSNNDKGDFIQNVLKLSFDNLPSSLLKMCFALCSIFPKGNDIERKDLIELWMAGAYLPADQKSDMETVGNKFFNLLLHNSLLQVEDRDEYDNVSCCSMHDLVHDVAMKVNSISNEFYRDESKGKVKYVHTPFYIGGISDVMFSNIKSLHALTMMDYDVEELPSSIGELMHLRYLNISETNIKDLPDTIGELYHLQTLRAISYRLRKLPSTLKYLIGLRHLHVFDHTELSGELGKLTSLQTIPYFRVGDEEGHRIVELGSLKNLKGRLKIYNHEKVRDKEEAKSACIFQKRNIVELVLHWSEYTEGEINCENVLEGLQPHSNLKGLEIFGFKGTRFPSWALRMGVQDERHWIGLNNLMEIRLERCECEEISMMGQLPQLKSLYLSDLTNVKSIGSSFYGVFKDAVVVFPALKRLELRNISNVREWVEVELASVSRQVEVFPCLEYLVISCCRKLKSAPSHFPCLKELEIDNMNSGLPLENICGTKLRSLIKLKIWGIEELESLPHWLFYSNQHSLELGIGGCRRLRELADGLHHFNCLQELNISHCPSLKSIPDCSSGSFTLLCNLEIQDCEELMNLSAEMIESCAPSLKRLVLGGLKKVMNMQMIIDCLHKMPRLTSLSLTSLPKFIIPETPTFPNLERLRMGPHLDSCDLDSFKEAVDGILIRLTSQSLHTLELQGMADWESLLEQLQHLSALVELRLFYFGIEEVPEWFGNLSSLHELDLWNCNKLRRLPSEEAMRRLTNLTSLSIYDCPLLIERGIIQQNNDHDSQWPNISHITDIWVDGRALKRVQIS